MRGNNTSIGELSKRTGVHIETIRYYERIGIMPKAARTSGGHRIYSDELVRRLAFVARGRQLGFSLDEIRSLLSLVDKHTYTCADVRDITLSHAEAVKSKIADLRRMERLLRKLASQCEGDQVPDCPVIDALADVSRVSGGRRSSPPNEKPSALAR